MSMDRVDQQSLIEWYINAALRSALSYLGEHNLGVDLWEHFGVGADKDDLRRTVARGVAMGLMEVAEGRDPMVTPPTIVSTTPLDMLRSHNERPDKFDQFGSEST